MSDDWCAIPAGAVTLSAGGYLDWPARVEMGPFAMARYPVTNEEFAAFVAAGGYDDPRWWTADGWRAQQRFGWSAPRYWRDRDWSRPNCPVVGVSWREATAYASWLAASTGRPIRLPDEAEWQRAAQGDDGREFPWGNALPDDTRCNWNRAVDETTPVTNYPAGASPYGVMDLSGNVWEWLRTGWRTGLPEGEPDEPRLLRGGCWSSDSPLSLRVYHRHPGDPNARLLPTERNLVTVGFRLVSAATE
jgi:formylglycine-generating enzyme required for sulfatase activity